MNQYGYPNMKILNLISKVLRKGWSKIYFTSSQLWNFIIQRKWT